MMNPITKFLLRFSIFWVVNTAIDVYVFDQPIKHLWNISIALIVAGVFSFLDAKDRRAEEDE